MPTGATLDSGWSDAFSRDIGTQVRAVTEDVADDARHGCPVDTGAMLRTIETEHPRSDLGLVWVGTQYWDTVEFGSNPHEIRPRTKQALAWPGGAHPVARVNHPGTPEQPFMRPALYRSRRLGGV